MHNLVSSLPRHHQRTLRAARTQALAALALIVIASWPLIQLPPPEPAAVAEVSASLRASRLPPQPWQQHLQLWHHLGQVQPGQRLLTQLDYHNGRWTFYLQMKDLAELGPWLDDMRQRAGLRLELRSAESRQHSFHVIIDGQIS